jgi:hypothetical protein
MAANRRNAKKSTGPKTEGGKKRAGRNAFRHGLAARVTLGDAFSNQLEELARSIAGEANSAIRLACARTVAEATLDVARVRRAKVALIEQVARLGYIDSAEAWSKPSRLTGRSSKPIESPDPMSLQEPERSAEAIRRSLPELLKLDRYEHRAASRRDRGIRELRKLVRE